MEPLSKFESFLNDAATRRLSSLHRTERDGQNYMNVLSAFDRNAYTTITGSLLDPFYLDSRIPAFLGAVADYFDAYPEEDA